MSIEFIFIAPKFGKPQIECEQISLIAGKGIEGDRNFDCHQYPGQNITLIEVEEIEFFLAENTELNLHISFSRRNLITRGVRLNDLVGKEFKIGNVLLKGIELCEPCINFGQSIESSNLPAHLIVKRFVHRGGLRADILTDGIISKDNKITF